METNNDVIWYGPHACAVCGVEIVKAAREQGGQELEPPELLMRIYRRGAENGNPDLVYPMAWTTHVHRTTDGPRCPNASGAAPEISEELRDRLRKAMAENDALGPSVIPADAKWTYRAVAGQPAIACRTQDTAGRRVTAFIQLIVSSSRDAVADAAMIAQALDTEF